MPRKNDPTKPRLHGLDHRPGGEDPLIDDLVGCKVYKSAAQSISNATDTMLTFNLELFDNDIMHDNSTNNSRITIKTAGLYLIQAQVAFTGNATGRRVLNLYKNGVRTDLRGSGAEHPGSISVTANVFGFSTILNLAVNDYIESGVYQTSGGALNATSGAVNTLDTAFSAVRLGTRIG